MAQGHPWLAPKIVLDPKRVFASARSGPSSRHLRGVSVFMPHFGGRAMHGRVLELDWFRWQRRDLRPKLAQEKPSEGAPCCKYPAQPPLLRRSTSRQYRTCIRARVATRELGWVVLRRIELWAVSGSGSSLKAAGPLAIARHPAPTSPLFLLSGCGATKRPRSGYTHIVPVLTQPCSMLDAPPPFADS